MSASIDLERRLATWLEQDGPADVPAAAVEAALAQARTIRQRRARLTRSWWDRRPLVAAPAPVEAGAIEPGERIPTFPVARSPLRPAWVLLLLAGLLAALVGGTLLVGSQQRRLPAVVPPVGQVFECPPGSTPDEPGPVDQARPPLSWLRRRWRSTAGQAGWWSRGYRLRLRDLDVRRVHEHLDPDAPEPGTPEQLHFGLVYDVDSDVTVAVDWTGGCGPMTSRPTPGRRRATLRSMMRRSGSTNRSRASSSPSGTTAPAIRSAWCCGATRSRPTRGPRSPRRSRWPSDPTTKTSPTTPPSIGLSRTPAPGGARRGRELGLRDQDVALRPPHRHLVGDGRRHAGVLRPGTLRTVLRSSTTRRLSGP